MTALLEPDVTKRWSMTQVLNSDWIAMDPRLLVMTPAEKMAVTSAQEERRKIQARQDVKASKSGTIKVSFFNNVKLIYFRSQQWQTEKGR